MSQREAAIEAVKKAGLNQNCFVDVAVWNERIEWKNIFQMRLSDLKKSVG